MAISAESTEKKILVTINDSSDKTYFLQRAFYKDRTWYTWTEDGFVILPQTEETDDNSEEAAAINAGDFIDSYSLESGLWEYRYIDSEKGISEKGDEWNYSSWVKFGTPDAIGYTFGNYKAPEGEWGTVMTPDDFRYTYLWGTDFKATNGTYFTDEQVQFFIDEATAYIERELNISIVKKRFATQAADRKLDESEYDEEESAYDFSYRKIQRYGMIQTKHRPILNISKCEMINKYLPNENLLPDTVIDRKQGVIKFLKRPFIPSDKARGISTSLGRYGSETFQPHLFYLIDYSAGYENSDKVPQDLRQIIGKVCAVSLLNIIGDGLMSGFSSSSLSMDGMSESFSSTQSATSAYFGARIAVYQKEIENYIKENKYHFGFLPIGCL